MLLAIFLGASLVFVITKIVPFGGFSDSSISSQRSQAQRVNFPPPAYSEFSASAFQELLSKIDSTTNSIRSDRSGELGSSSVEHIQAMELEVNAEAERRVDRSEKKSKAARVSELVSSLQQLLKQRQSLESNMDSQLQQFQQTKQSFVEVSEKFGEHSFAATRMGITEVLAAREEELKRIEEKEQMISSLDTASDQENEEAIQVRLRVAKSALSGSEKKVTSEMSKTAALRRQIESIQANIGSLETADQKREDRLSELLSEERVLEDSVARETKEAQDARLQLDQLEIRRAKTQALLSELDHLHEIHETLRKTVAAKTHDFESLQRTVREIGNEVSESSDVFAEDDEVLLRAQRQAEKSRQHALDSAAQLEKFLELDASGMASSSSDYEQSRTELLAKLEDLGARIANAKAVLNSFTKKGETAERDLRSVRTKIKELSSKSEDQKREKLEADLELKNAELESSQQFVETLQKEVIDHRVQLESCNSDLEKHRRSIEVQAERMSSLQLELRALQSNVQKLESELVQLANSASEDLDKLSKSQASLSSFLSEQTSLREGIRRTAREIEGIDKQIDQMEEEIQNVFES